MSVRVLAVGDPAVYGYTDSQLGIIELFMERSGISVEFDILPWEKYGPRLFAVAAETEPAYDIVMVAGHLWLAQFVNAEYLEPLDGYRALSDASFDSEDIHPTIASEMRYQGSTWLVPSFTDGHIVYADSGVSGLLSRAEIQDPRQYLDLVERLSKTKIRNLAPLVMKVAPSEIFLDWLPYLYSFGGECFGAGGEPLFDNDAGREALEYYLRLTAYLSEKHAPFGNEEVAAALRTGEAAFGLSWGGQAGVIVTEEHVRNERFVYETPMHPWNVTWSFGVLSAAANKHEAVELLAYLGSREVDRHIGVYAGSPVRKSTYQDAALRKRCPWFTAQETLLEQARPLPHIAILGDLIAPLYAELSRALRGECGAGEALVAARVAVEQQLEHT